MAFGKFLVAAASATALITAPTMAAASQAPIAADTRAAETDADEDQLFGNQRGGILALILIAAAIAIGVYIVLDDEEDEEPASP